jgi:hypothetical protein
VPDEGIDVRIRLRDARQFKADTTSTAGAIAGIGKASQKSNDQIRRSSRVGSGALRSLTRSVIGLGVAYLGIGAAKSAITTTLGLAKTTVSLHRNLGLTNKVASEWAASAVARGVDTNALSLAFTNLSKNVEAARGGDKKAVATARAHSLALDELAAKSKDRIAAYKAQQVLQLAAVSGNRVETAAVRARGLVQLTALKREDLLIKARQKTAAATLAALSGGKKAMATFRELGITQDDLRRGSHDFNFILGKIAEGLGRMPGGAKRAALAQKLLGRSSQTTLPIFTQGRASMQANLKLADKYGVTLSKNPLKAVRQLAHAQKEMEFAQLGWQVTFATKVAPALTKLILLVTRGSQWLAKHKTITSILIPAVIAFAAATWIVNAAMAANPVVLVVAGLVALGVALVMAYTKFTTFRNIVNAVFDWIKSHWKLVTGILTGGLVPAIAFVINHWNDILGFFGGLPEKIKKKTLGLFDGIKGAFVSAINFIIGIWNKLNFTIPGVDVPGIGEVGGWTIGVGHIDPIGTGSPATKTKTTPGHVQRGGGTVKGGAGATKQVQSLAPGEGAAVLELHNHTHLDGREVARSVQQFTLSELARA